MANSDWWYPLHLQQRLARKALPPAPPPPREPETVYFYTWKFPEMNGSELFIRDAPAIDSPDRFPSLSLNVR